MYRLHYNVLPRILINLILIIPVILVVVFIFYKLNRRINLLEQSISVNQIQNNKSSNLPSILESNKYIDLYQKSISDHMLFDFHTVDKDFTNFSNEDLNKLEQICTFKIGQERDKIYLSKAFQCLAKINQFRYNEKDQIFKSIKNISQALEISYLPENISLLAKTMIIGFEDKVPEKFQDLTKFFTGYKKDEIATLNELGNLNIKEITARVNYRLAMIHILGRSSIKEIAEPNFRLAIEEIKQVLNITNIKSDNIMDIVLGSDVGEINGVLLTIVSALINSDITSFYRFHIINTDSEPIPKNIVDKLEAMKNIRDYHFNIVNLPTKETLIKDNSILHQINLVNKDSNSYKLYLDKILPSLESVLYLDNGALVLRDLTYFKQIDIKNYFIAAAIDLNTILTQRELCHDLRDFYVNSGVVFFNLNKIRQENNLLKVNSVRNCDFAYPEQDMLNILFENHIYYVSPRWNNIIMLTNKDQNTNEPVSFIKNYHKNSFIVNEKNKQIFTFSPEKLSAEEVEILHYQEMTNYN